jgi:RHS repeat-associated protein
VVRIRRAKTKSCEKGSYIQAFLAKKFTGYERDVSGSDEAMHRRYQSSISRFSQPDPYDGSYSLTDPQSFNCYAYTQNDPVNFVDPSGLNLEGPGGGRWRCSGTWSAMLQPDGSITDFRITSMACITWVGSGGGGAGGVGGDKGDRPPTNPEGKVTRQNLCDDKLASIFGEPGAVADSGRTPSTLLHSTAGMQRFADHSAEGGVIHLYTNAQGTAATVGLYIPEGFSKVPGGSGVQRYPLDSKINPGQVNFNYSQYKNSAGITISFVHIGPPAGPATNAFGSRRVGSIAGPNTGGDAQDGDFSSDLAHRHPCAFRDLKNIN